MTTQSIQDLREFAKGLAPGPITDSQRLVDLLQRAWADLAGGEETKMEVYKLTRIEEPSWRPPRIKFIIERHGGTVLGSTRAELHTWVVDLDRARVDIAKTGHRQLQPMEPRLDVNPLAESLAQAIVDGKPDDRIRRMKDGSVRIKMGLIIPSTNKQTTAGRRKQLRCALVELLRPQGWARSGRTTSAAPNEPAAKPAAASLNCRLEQEPTSAGGRF